MRTPVIVAAVMAFVLAAIPARGDELAIGDKAPALSDVSWIKGDPSKEYEEGTIYVLDFWATWCRPCRAAIPHLSKLAEEYKDKGVEVIGVAVFPREGMVPVDTYVEDNRDTMSYAVAEDNDEGTTAFNYMTRTFHGGIPTVMIVNREGRLAWYGHPTAQGKMGAFEDALAEIVAGGYDIEAAKGIDKERRDALRERWAPQIRMHELRPKIEPLQEKWNKAAAEGDWPAVLDAMNEIASLDPEMFTSLYLQQYALASTRMQDREAMETVEKRVLGNETIMNSHRTLNRLAWFIVDPNGQVHEEMRDVEFAMTLAQKANELTDGGEWHILDTIARAHFIRKNHRKAIEYQQKAIEAAEGDQKALTRLRKALEEYKNAASQS